MFTSGNLALSRALGDFEFKRNTELSAEEQIVTGESVMATIGLTVSVLA